MAIFHLKNVVLPAVLISSAVFSVLTLPFVLVKSEQPVEIDLPFLTEPLMVDLPPLLKSEVQPILESDNRDLAIRYIGGSIVASVGVGIGTIEVLRRLHASRRIVQYPDVSLAQQFDLQFHAGSDFSDLESIEFTPYSEAAFSQSGESLFPVTLPDASVAQTPPATLPAPAESHAAVMVLDTAAMMLEPHQRFEYCRIRIPSLEHRLYAILFEGNYYSYFKTQPTANKALDVANKLIHRGNRAVVTQTDRGYDVWLWQPDAYLDA